MSYQTRRELDPNGQERITIYRPSADGGMLDKYEVGMGPNKGGTWIHSLDDDFGRADPNVLNRPLGYLYQDVDGLIALALSTFVAEREQHRHDAAEAELLRRQTDTRREYFGIPVDLSCAAPGPRNSN